MSSRRQTKLPPLWQCPACKRKFANRNQSHACGRHDLAHHFAGKPSCIKALYKAFVREIRRCGRVTILPERTRIAFQVRMSFAQLTPKRNWIDGHLVLARRVDSPLFTRVETFSPRNHLHAFRLKDTSQLNAEFRGFLREAFAVGEQKHLRRSPPA